MREVCIVKPVLVVFDFQDFPSCIMPTVGAHAMGKMFLTAVGARDQIPGAQRIMCAPTISATF